MSSHESPSGHEPPEHQPPGLEPSEHQPPELEPPEHQPPELEPSEHQPPELEPPELELAERLAADRPVPAAEFRGVLGRHLAARDPGYGPRPAHLHAAVWMSLAAGCVLAALGALVAVGAL